MKTVKKYQEFTSSINERKNIEMVNEEWYPQGPWMNLKSIPGGALVEQWNKNTLNFVGGTSEHISTYEQEIFQIIETLYSEKYVDDNFNLHGIDDCTITKLIFQYSNHKQNIEEFLEKIKEYGTIQPRDSYAMIIVELTKPIEILLKDSTEKTNNRNIKQFNTKIDTLFDHLENSELPNTTEVNDLLDKLILILDKNKIK